jgi:hypothetical protein
MILRTAALVAALALRVAAPLPAEAQAAVKVWRIGYLSLVAGEREEYKPWLAGFRDALRHLGYVEGDNLVVNTQTAKALGLAIPSALLLRADHLVQ